MPSTPALLPTARPSTARANDLPPRREPTTPVDLVRWPLEAARRDQLRALGLPRVLVLEADADPPLVWDDLEDWVRAGAEPDELTARSERVAAAAAARRPSASPTLSVDADGTVRRGGRTATVSTEAAPIVAVLLDRIDRPVARRDLEHVVAAALLPGGLDAVLRPLRRALRPLGVRIEQAGPDALVLFVIEPPEGAR